MFASSKKPTNQTNGKFAMTDIRPTNEGEGKPAEGASFLFDDGKVRAVFHSFRAPSGKFCYTGMVPSQLRNKSAENVTDSANMVLALNV